MAPNTSGIILTLAVFAAFALPSKRLLKRETMGPWFTDFPDPGVVFADDGNFYAYSTNSGPRHIPVASSVDIMGPWDYVTDDQGNPVDALPSLPSWYTSGCGQTWAPDVVQLGGTYSMLFAGPSNTENAAFPGQPCRNYFCIGVASSSDPAGPFEPAPNPVICREGESVIDPSHFTDVDGKTYYLFSGAGAIYIQQHDINDVTTLIGDATTIWRASNADDAAGVSEAPFLVFDGTAPGEGSPYYLFYSTGTYSQSDYTVTYATSPFILGPYAEQGALLATGDPAGADGTLLGPGGATLIPGFDPESWYMAFHALSSVGGPRPLYTAQVDIQDGVPAVQ